MNLDDLTLQGLLDDAIALCKGGPGSGRKPGGGAGAGMIASQNTKFGFHGAIVGKYGAQRAGHLFHAVAADIAKRHGVSHEVARNYLDSKHGRHLAHQMLESGRGVHHEMAQLHGGAAKVKKHLQEVAKATNDGHFGGKPAAKPKPAQKPAAKTKPAGGGKPGRKPTGKTKPKPAPKPAHAKVAHDASWGALSASNKLGKTGAHINHASDALAHSKRGNHSAAATSHMAAADAHTAASYNSKLSPAKRQQHVDAAFSHIAAAGSHIDAMSVR